MVIRPIAPADDPAMADIIRRVMTEHGASGPGFAIHDLEVGAMSSAYAPAGHAFWVVEVDGEVKGGGGIAPLHGGPPGVCELRKMYFLPEARGRGWGEALLRAALTQAKALGYATCYLETLTGMDAAQRLYRRVGFEPRAGPMGTTGHYACDRYFTRAL